MKEMGNGEESIRSVWKSFSQTGLMFFLMCTLILGLGAHGARGAAGDRCWYIQRVDSLGDVGYYSSVALDSSDRPHISYYALTDANLKYTYFDGIDWQTEIVDPGLGVGDYTSLALDSNDNPHISYFEHYRSNLKYAYYDGASWHIETVDSIGSVGMCTSIALDGSDNPHISYYDYTKAFDGDLKYAYYDGASWHVETVDSIHDVGWFSSIALDSNDNPHISYSNFTDYDLKYAYYNGISWHIETVDSATDNGLFTSIALDSNSDPHISYLGSGLQYAYHDGMSWQIEVVDGVGSRGGSIALDSSEKPHIAYPLNVSDRLKYAYYDGSVWHMQIVDDQGGPFVSIALDNTDNAHVSYDDHASVDLKYAYTSPTTSLTITGTGGGTTDPASGTHTYACRCTVQVTAIPDSCYLFDHWELDGSNAGSVNPILVFMDGDHTLHAVFVPIDYPLTITTTPGGTTVPAPGIYSYPCSASVEVEITAIPDSCYMLDHWEFDGGNAGSTNPYSVLMDNDHTLHAVFIPIEFALTITTTAGGTTDPSPGIYTAPCTSSVHVQVWAIPEPWYLFDHWELDGGNVGSANPCSVLMDDDHWLHALFVLTDCLVWPTILDFGPVEAGTYKDSTFTITNFSGDTLSGNVSESCDHYSIVYGEGPYSLAPGESLIVIVRFEPDTLGQLDCTVETGSAICSDVSCTGIGGEEASVNDRQTGATPADFILSQNSPNPFRATTVIGYGLAVDCHVRLDIYSVSGRRVSTLVDGYRPAGYGIARWDAVNEHGMEVPAGIYFYRLQAANYTETRKMILLK